MGDEEKDIIDEFEESLSQSDSSRPINAPQYIMARRKKMKLVLMREETYQKEESYAYREEALNHEAFKLRIEKENWNRDKDMHRILEEDKIRHAENERRLIEDARRKLEDERRSLEDERRRVEDERRNLEDTRRAEEKKRYLEEEEERRKFSELEETHKMRKITLEEKKVLLQKLKEEEFRMRHLESIFLDMGVEDIDKYIQLEKEIARGVLNMSDDTLIINILGGNMEDALEQENVKDHEIVESIDVKEDDELDRFERLRSDLIKYSESKEPTDLDWVFLDSNQEDDKRFSIDKILAIFRKPHTESPPPVKVQEVGVTTSHTRSFLKARKAIQEKNQNDVSVQVKVIHETLSENKSNIISLFSSIVISNKDTWSKCKQCDKYFDRLSIKLECQLCGGATCKACDVQKIVVSTRILGIQHDKPILKLKTCATCTSTVQYLSRVSMVKKTHNPQRISDKVALYHNIVTLRSNMRKALLEIQKVGVDKFDKIEPFIHDYLGLMRKLATALNQLKSEIRVHEKMALENSLPVSTDAHLKKMIVMAITQFIFDQKKFVYAFQKLMKDAEVKLE